MSIPTWYHRKFLNADTRNMLTSTSLEKLWIPGRGESMDSSAVASDSSPDGGDQDFQMHREESAASTVSLGDTHIWRDNGDENV